MRNEGMFVVEWLAHHLVCGFDGIFVYTNDCLDGSDLLLARLQELGFLTHVDHRPPEGASPQIHAMALAMRDPRVRAHEWLLHIDADEFLHLDEGINGIGGLLERIGGEADVIIFLWKLFGSNGLERWEGGNVLESFTRSQGRPMRKTVNHKSMFRIACFGRCTDHMPKGPLVDEIRLVNTVGTRLDPQAIKHPRKSRFKISFRNQVFTNACLYHYAVKTPDLFLMKNDRGDGHGHTHARYHINSRLHRRYDRNEVKDRSILRLWPRVEAKMAQIREDAEVRRLEAACHAWYRARREKVLTPEQVAAWTQTATEAV